MHLRVCLCLCVCVCVCVCARVCAALLDTVVSVLLHPGPSARLAAAWCLRSVATAMPSQRCPLLERCAERLAALKSSPEAVSGYSAAVAALLAGAQHCALGLPHSTAQVPLTWSSPGAHLELTCDLPGAHLELSGDSPVAHLHLTFSSPVAHL